MTIPLIGSAGALTALVGGLLAPLATAGGVTLVTHGYDSDIESWVMEMADRIPGHPGFPGTDFTCYKLTIAESGGQLTPSVTLLSGTSPLTSDSGEIFIKLDWSSESGLFGGSSSTEIATAAVAAMLSTGLIPELNGRALAELPMHLIGHSRGASVVSEMTRLFGAEGVWIDHLTFHDPVDDTFGDGEVFAWENVLFLDNYWQVIGGFFVPVGKPVLGAYNRQLTSLGGGYGSAHSDVHLWYHGTVQLETPASDSLEDIFSAQRDNWWVGAEESGAKAGFYYSRIGGGDRLSTDRPLGTGTDQIRDGFNQNWDFGAGAAGNRTILPANSGQWPSVITSHLPSSTPVAIGESFDLEIDYASGQTASGDAELRIRLDPDRNPWNGNEIEIAPQALPNSGPFSVSSATVSATVPAGFVTPGLYAVCARITEGERPRYLYAADFLEVIAPLPPPFIDRSTLRLEAGLVAFTVIATTGQSVTILATSNLVDWEPIDTQLLASDTWEFTDVNSASYPRRFYVPVLDP